MRTFTVLRALALAAALSTPLAQAALACPQDPPAMTGGSAPITPSYGGGPYNNDAVMSPSVDG